MADGFAACDTDRSTEALGAFAKGYGHRLDVRGFHGEVALLGYGCPDGANIGIAGQNRYEVGFTIPSVINLSDEPVQPQSNSRSGVLHSLRVFQHPEALVGILHTFLVWDFDCGVLA